MFSYKCPVVKTHTQEIGNETHQELSEEDAGSLGRMAILVAMLTVPGSSYSQGMITMTDPGTLGGPGSMAVSLNDAGQVGGSARIASEGYHATLWAVPLHSPAPDEQIEQIIADVMELADTGSLGPGQAAALTQTLENAERALEGENRTGACNILHAFANHVQAQANAGIISQADAQPLIYSANSLIDRLCG